MQQPLDVILKIPATACGTNIITRADAVLSAGRKKQRKNKKQSLCVMVRIGCLCNEDW